MNETLLERFIRYTKINTRSDERSNTTPTTKVQEDFLFMLKKRIRRFRVRKYSYNSWVVFNSNITC